MQFTIKVEWQREDGSLATEEMGPVDVGPCQSAADVGLQLADGQRILVGCRRVWSAHNCNGTVRLSDCVRSVIASGI
jgi:hypothetical protein